MDGNLVTIFATIGSTLGVSGIFAVAAKAVADWMAGKPGREQKAWEQRDSEARARRILEESLHEHRNIMIRSGMDLKDLPEWPKYSTHDKQP